ncbi:uncharacterized protein VTP21DRAFT_8071 [Calcarisporiella thermophila]|uniref:uncharacterized protein n=1 Tax=Calcarisporiella thermophila TaxID=911321 RepID=UPI003742144B
MSKSKKEPEDFERTPEYNAFWDKLCDFHQKYGTGVQMREPVLGSKKLDLLMMYRLVLEQGGYETVTREKLWRQIGDPFKFPPTCTNSAFVLKTVYMKYLSGFEEVHHWKRPWKPPLSPPPTRSGSPATNLRKDVPASKLQSIHATTRSSSMAISRAHPVQSSQQYRWQPTPVTPMSYQTSQAQYLQQVQQGAKMGIDTEGYYLNGGPKNRILLALKSELPNEIDWAFSRLITLSYECPDDFRIDLIPNLLDILLSFTTPFFERCRSYSKIIAHSNASHEGGKKRSAPEDSFLSRFFTSKSDQELIHRVLQAFLIIRNFSFLDHNSARMAEHVLLRQLLMECLVAPAYEQQVELQNYCIDIFENMSAHITLRTRKDEVLQLLWRMLFAEDRSMILGSLRSLTRLATNEHNHAALSGIDRRLVSRLAELLLLEDEEIVAAALDHLYQYSATHVSFTRRFLTMAPANFVRLLITFLRWPSPISPPSNASLALGHQHTQQSMGRQINGQPPPSIPPECMNVKEPFRALFWIKTTFIEGTMNDIAPQNALFELYRSTFSSVGDGRVLALSDLLQVIKICFPKSESGNFPFKGSNVPSVRGIRSKVPLPTVTGPPQQVKTQAPMLGPINTASPAVPKQNSTLPVSTSSSTIQASSTTLPTTLPSAPTTAAPTILATTQTTAPLSLTAAPHAAPQHPATPSHTSTPESEAEVSTLQQVPSTDSIPQPTSTNTAPSGSRPDTPADTPSSANAPPTEERESEENDGDNESDKEVEGERDGEREDGTNQNEQQNGATEDEMNIDVTPPKFPCHWPECKSGGDDVGKLFAHILEVHLPRNIKLHRCQWKSCQQYSQGAPRSQVAAHIKVHLPTITTEGSSPLSTDANGANTASTMQTVITGTAPRPETTAPVSALPAQASNFDPGDPMGVPLTSALVLRNFARIRENHIYFVPYEAELAMMTVEQPVLSKYLSIVLAELKG